MRSHGGLPSTTMIGRLDLTSGGGGTIWDSMAYDPELDLLYIGVGNGSPWNQAYRSPGGGDNLYLSSIVAIRPKTGEYVWHYQTTPGETWDYTATQHIMLADDWLHDRTPETAVVAKFDRRGSRAILAALNASYSPCEADAIV